MKPLSTDIKVIFNDKSQAKILVELLTGNKMTPTYALKYIRDNIGIGEINEVQDAIEEYNNNLQ